MCLSVQFPDDPYVYLIQMYILVLRFFFTSNRIVNGIICGYGLVTTAHAVVRGTSCINFFQNSL